MTITYEIACAGGNLDGDGVDTESFVPQSEA